jgi:outer membrane receptor protein involved in Fe transport
VRDLGDIAKHLPGVRIQQRVQGQEAAASVEGMPPEYTRVLIDGQHYAGELGGVADLADLPLVNAERIVVIRGPQAMRYGSDAAGAVLEIQTREPPSDSGARLFLEGGAGGDAHHHLAQAAALRLGRLGATLSTSYRGIDGQEPRGSDAVVTGAGEDSREESRDVYTTLRYDLRESLALLSKVGWRREEDDFATEEGSARRTTKRWLEGLGLRGALGANSDFELELFHFRGDTRSDLGRSFRLRESEWKVDASVRSDLEVLGVQPELRLGFDWCMPALEQGEGELAPGALEPNAFEERFTSGGVFAILEVPLPLRSMLELGAREQLHSRFESKLLPQAALVLEPHDSLRLRLGYGRYYRIPSLRDLYQPPVPNLGGAYFLAGNPDLETESASGLRLGLEWTPLDRLTLSATYFQNRIEDFIRSGLVMPGVVIGEEVTPPVYGPDHILCRINPASEQCQPTLTAIERPLYRKSNLDRVRTRGFELQARLQPASDLELRLGYGFLATEVDSPTLIDLKELPNEPRHTLDLEGSYVLPGVDAELTLRARWRGKALTESSGTGLASFTSLDHSDPSWSVDLRLIQPLRHGLSLYLDVENLTNEDVIDSYEIRARTLFVGLRYELD